MPNMKCDVVTCETESSNAWNDNRFNIIQDNARETQNLVRELNKLSEHKFGELLGNYEPASPIETQKEISSQCWADKIVQEQEITISIVKTVLDKISAI